MATCACEPLATLEPVDRDKLVASRPKGFKLPPLSDLEGAVKDAIGECARGNRNGSHDGDV